ncbi:unnamed protein product [Acanthoscelides obtectus]|uniref:guanine deaminase n=2 Tax=Acanthoscelides obtectus TaxID=200917 RepID=A0A9P0PXA1_ACAOB|nr:unnamed protein product [Acanthoscelides obtectus]CAK1641603.1 Guanine deaminase [Acanthoscelides obtectus]
MKTLNGKKSGYSYTRSWMQMHCFGLIPSSVAKMSSGQSKIFLGNIFHCQNDPAKKQLYRISNEQGGFVIVKRSKIMAIGRKEDLEQARAQHLADEQDVMVTVLSDRQLLIPGFVDTHIHAPQYPNCGLGYDKPLLEWLQAYTYKLERKYRDLEYSRKVFNAVVRRTLNHGTTTACYFASLFQDASLILVDAVLKYGQRAFIGKINMTTLAPDDYVETPEETIKLTRKFIESVRSKDCELVEPIVTPRFALSLEMDSMIELGQLVKEYNVNVQTHISENTDEVKQVNSKYGLPYANVYDKAGLLTPKTVLAHGIYLTDEELSLLSQRGSSVSHCPDSNTCLKSGMCDVRRLFSFGIKVGLGTDVSGGASPSIVSAMRSALATSINLSFGQKNYKPLNYLDVFYLATLGGAEDVKQKQNWSSTTQ